MEVHVRCGSYIYMYLSRALVEYDIHPLIKSVIRSILYSFSRSIRSHTVIVLFGAIRAQKLKGYLCSRAILSHPVV